MNFKSTNISQIRKNLLESVLPSQMHNEDYGIVITLKSTERAELPIFRKSPIVHKEKFPLMSINKIQEGDLIFKPKRLQVSRHSKIGLANTFISPKDKVIVPNLKHECVNKHNEDVKESIKKIRTLALELKELRQKPKIRLFPSWSFNIEDDLQINKKAKNIKPHHKKSRTMGNKFTTTEKKNIESSFYMISKIPLEEPKKISSLHENAFVLNNNGINPDNATNVNRGTDDEEIDSAIFYSKISEGIITDEDTPMTNRTGHK